MLEMLQLRRYEHAPIVSFGPNYDPAPDADALAQWLVDFCQRRSRPPEVLIFTFRATDDDQESVCSFMKAVTARPAAAEILSQARIEMDFGEMSPAVSSAVFERISTKQF